MNDAWTGRGIPAPTCKLAAHLTRAPEGSPKGKDAPAVARAQRRILIVEDEALIAWNLQMMVEGFGYTICGTAATGKRAIALAAQEQPDLILMDVRLADNVSGLQAAEQILDGRPLPIVFITAFTDGTTAERIAALGAHCLNKPVVPQLLGEVLERLLDRSPRH